jgi:hypothetical protein
MVRTFSRLRLCGVALLPLGLAPLACAPAPTDVTHRLRLPGLNGATPSIAARGDRLAVAWGATAADGRIDVYLATSTDGGRAVGVPVRVNDPVAEVRVSGEQPPQVVFVGDAVVVAWTARREGFSEIRFATSRDGGRTFGASRLAHAAGLPGMRGWVSAASDPGGQVHLAWLDGRNAAPPPEGHAHGHGASGPAPRQDLYRATIDGESISEEQVATDVCFCCKTSVQPTRTGVAVAWRHIFPESMRDIAVASPPGSGDGALIVRVAQDDWHIDACPDDGPSLAIDPAGVRHVLWPTLVTSGDAPGKGIFYAASPDGLTFSQRVRLDVRDDAIASHPRVAAFDDGSLIAVWDERHGGTRRVVTRRMTSGGAWEAPAVVEAAATAYYPDVAVVRDGAVVVWTSQTEPETTIVIRRLTAD